MEVPEDSSYARIFTFVREYIIMSWEFNALSVNQCIIMNINFVWFGCMSDIFEDLTKKKNDKLFENKIKCCCICLDT